MEALNNPGRKPGAEMFTRNEKREKMSNLRKTVSRRLVEAKNTTAMLTTFNEVDMSRIMALVALGRVHVRRGDPEAEPIINGRDRAGWELNG